MQTIELFGVQAAAGVPNRPVFKLSDVCKVFGLHPAIADDLGDGEIEDLKIGEDRVKVVTEPGFYRLGFFSENETGHAFQEWLIDKVLPEIFSTGSYKRKGGH